MFFSLSSFTFLQPWWLLAGIIIPVVGVFLWQKLFRAVPPVRVVSGQFSLFGRVLPWISLFAFLAGLLGLILAAAGLSQASTTERLRYDGIDIAIVLDISKSMLAEDIQPSRITAAKGFLKSFIAERGQGDRLSLTLFAGKPFTSVPLTFDRSALQEMLTTVSTDSIEQSIPGLSGTAMGDGVLMGLRTLSASGWITETTPAANKREQVLIVITDGEANMGIHPESAAKLAAVHGVKIYSVGIGKPEGVELYTTRPGGGREYFRDDSGNPIMARLDEAVLTSIASMTRGQYFRASDTSTLGRVFATLATLNKKPAITDRITLSRPLTSYLLWGSFVALLFASIGILRTLGAFLGYTQVGKPLPSRLAVIVYGVGFIVSLACIVLGLLRVSFPIFAQESLALVSSSRSIVFLLDTSKSMDVRDITQDGTIMSRFDSAVATIGRIVAAHSGDKFGLIIFAGDALRVSPITSDRSAFLTFLAGITTSTITRQGTNIRAALDLVLESATTQSGSLGVVLLSDGGETDDTNIDTLTATLRSARVVPKILAIGIGTERGWVVPVEPTATFRPTRPPVSRLNTIPLSTLARVSGWNMVLSSDFTTSVFNAFVATLPPEYDAISSQTWANQVSLADISAIWYARSAFVVLVLSFGYFCFYRYCRVYA